MEGNKDEAEKCISIAIQSIKSGNKEKALKFLQKANKLYPLKKAEDLITQLSESGASGGESNGASAAEPNKEAEDEQSRKEEASKPTEHTYTQEQYALVNKILKCKDFYGVLEVATDCCEDDLKKAYRKLALKLHPDKNHAPGATEAFKAVGKAWSTLSDPEKRQRYDRFGNEAEEAASPHRQRRQGFTSQGFYYYDEDDEISAEEVFNMFFGGAFPGNNLRRRNTFHMGRPQTHHHHHHHTQHPTDAASAVFYQLFPIFIMMGMALLGLVFAPEAVFNLDHSQKYNTPRYTRNLQIPYFVKPGFDKEYQGSLSKVEREVEETYVANLRHVCFKERSNKENMLWRARTYGDHKMYERAQNQKTPSCEKLQKLYGGG